MRGAGPVRGAVVLGGACWAFGSSMVCRRPAWWPLKGRLLAAFDVSPLISDVALQTAGQKHVQTGQSVFFIPTSDLQEGQGPRRLTPSSAHDLPEILPPKSCFGLSQWPNTFSAHLNHLVTFINTPLLRLRPQRPVAMTTAPRDSLVWKLAGLLREYGE